MVTDMGMLRTCVLVLAISGFYVSAQKKTLTCDFEKGLCPFLMNDADNKENWKLGRGKVKSGETGPAVDHTFGNASGSYLFVDTSLAKNYAVKLQTYRLTADQCVRFFYHMYGADIGDLTVEAKSANKGTDTTKYFTRSLTQGDRWKEAKFQVTRTAEMRSKGFNIIFTAKGKTNYRYTVLGDIALDDIEITAGNCKDLSTDAFSLCSFDNFDCGYTSLRSGSVKWEWQANTQSTSYFSTKPKIDHTLGTKEGGYWFCGYSGKVLGSLQTAMLNSPEYPKPETSTNCLHFYAYLDYTGTYMWSGVKENYIQVFLNFPNSKEPRKWIATKGKNTTEHARWTYVEARTEITNRYQFQFVVGLDSPAGTLAAIDDIKLLPGNCPDAGLCDFENNKCSWTDGEGDFSWIRKTPSSWSNNELGPGTDNTLKTYRGNYVVFNTVNKPAGSRANLESELFAPDSEDLCLSFYYNMNGDDLGTLKVVVKEENITESTVWALSGSQINGWNKGVAVIKKSILYTQIVFRGITGKGNRAYMALDDIRIRRGENCTLTPFTADPRYDAMEKLSCTFDNGDLCAWKQANATLDWKFGKGSLLESTGPKQPMKGTGQYLYISSYEGTQSNNEKVARLVSPAVSSFYPDAACFSFYFHMFGAHVGELRVILVAMKNDFTDLGKQVIWRRRGTQPDKWIKFSELLNVTDGDYRIEIEAEGGSGFAGDIAIDDILMSLGECPNVDICDFESSLCNWAVESKKNSKYFWRRVVKMPKGPKTDHTTNTDAGYYLQAVSNGKVNALETTNLISPQYSKHWGAHCLTFWYYRPGLSTGSINILTRIGKKEFSQWSASFDVGMIWHYGQITINEKSDFRILIKAVKGKNDDYEMALDDILIKNSACGEQAQCNFNNDYCSYFINSTSDFPWLLGTGRVVNTQLVSNPPVDNSIENGMYIYADMTSPNLKPNQQATIVSEILEGHSTRAYCLSFYYFIGGEDNCTLSAGKMTMGNEDVMMKYKVFSLFIQSDNTGRGWKQGSQDIPVDSGERFQVYFQATKNDGSRAFIAVDDVSASSGKCEGPTTEPPVTVTEMPVTSFSCDFDDGKMCSWSVDAGKALKWQVSEPTKAQGKMPKFDHTKGNYLGRYVYMKGNDAKTLEATITSQGADKEWNGNFCLSFWYFINVDGGDPKLRVSAEHMIGWSTRYVSFWEKKGNFGYIWRHAYVHINSKRIAPKVRISGFVKRGVIAIDDIAAKGGSCPPTKMCTFDDGDNMCSYTQDSKNSLDWDVKSGEDNDTLVRIADHTTQSIEGKYLYIGVNGTSKEKSLRSRIYSPKRPASETARCVAFYYHIYNVSKLSLNTYISTDNGVSDPQWSVSIGQGILWHGARFTVTSKQLSWQIVFEVEVGKEGYGQVAIDDITVSNQACDDPGACDFEDDDCLWENIRPPTSTDITDGLPKLDVMNADVPTDMLKDDFDWTLHIGQDYFGPPKDHTLGSPQGFYLLLDTRDKTFGQKAVYMSERLKTSSGVCFKLWYAIPSYANGATLQVYVSTNFKTAEQVKLIKDSTNENWKQALVSVIPPPTMDSSFNDFWVGALLKKIQSFLVVSIDGQSILHQLL